MTGRAIFGRLATVHRMLMVAALLSVACGEHPVEYSRIALAMVIDNGTGLNGTGLNGTGLNGTGLNGTGLNSVLLNGTSFDATSVGDVQLRDVSLEATAFRGTTREGASVQDEGFVGAQFVGEMADGSTVTLRVDSISPTNLPTLDRPVYLYAVSYRFRPMSHKGKGGWRPLCRKQRKRAPVLSIPLRGFWSYAEGEPGGGAKIEDPARFTFACLGGAIAKCVELGYAPWSAVGGVSVAGHHQACTRMIRADFCGDGRSWTADGTWINLYDNLGIQSDTRPWTVEAEWGPDGARCVKKPRNPKVNGRRRLPRCFHELFDPGCGDAGAFNEGTLLISESLRPRRREAKVVEAGPGFETVPFNLFGR